MLKFQPKVKSNSNVYGLRELGRMETITKSSPPQANQLFSLGRDDSVDRIGQAIHKDDRALKYRATIGINQHCAKLTQQIKKQLDRTFALCLEISVELTSIEYVLAFRRWRRCIVHLAARLYCEA